MGERIAIIGDVHGNARALAGALHWLESWDGLVILVGDYVNRGPESHDVLEQLLSADEVFGRRLILLRGNHEQVLIDFLAGENPKRLLAHGGLTTINSYTKARGERASIASFRDAFPASHRRLLAGTVTHYETDGLLVSHAGYNPAAPNSRSLDDMALGRHHLMFSAGAQPPRPLVVCGHYVQRGMQPYASESLLCLDTGSGTDVAAPLTMVTLPEIDFYQFYGVT
jgi:serine/threonine protein phosphatase 1